MPSKIAAILVLRNRPISQAFILLDLIKVNHGVNPLRSGALQMGGWPEEKHGNRFESHDARGLGVEPDATHHELMHPCHDMFNTASAFINSNAHRELACASAAKWQRPRELTPLAVEGLVLELFVEATHGISRGQSLVVTGCGGAPSG